MANTYGQPVRDLAEMWMEDSRGAFPPDDYDALVDMLASDLQDMLEDFTNPDYHQITMDALHRNRERKAEKAGR